MKRPSNDQRIRNLMTRGFAPFLDVPQQDVESACDRVLERLQEEPEDTPMISGRPVRSWFRPVVALSAMTAAAIVVVFLLVPASRVAVVENADGGLYRVDEGSAFHAGDGIALNEVVRTEGGLGAVLKLADGSTIEMRSKSELALEEAADGLRIRLGFGSVIVNAAKQRTGHLYVQTKHMTVAVVGTVFFVKAEEEGSRVAVIEGEVRVQQGKAEKKLSRGEQMTTDPKMPVLPVKEEIAWSRQAEAHLALLEHAATQISLEVQPKPQAPPTRKRTFEEATVRLSQGPTLEATGRGANPGFAFNGCTPPAILKPPAQFQVDPSRFAGRMNLYAWIIFAYSDYDCNVVYEFVEDLFPFEPQWLRSVSVQIEALFPDGGLAGKEYVEGKPAKLKEMIQALLEDRFKLIVRRTQREMQVVTLSVADGGPRLVPARESDIGCRTCSVHNGGPPNPRSFMGTKASSADIASYLTSRLFRLVVDRTGLTGEFTFRVDYVPYEGDIGIDARLFPSFRDSNANGPTLFGAIEKQLGLKLKTTKAPVDVLVIDRIERPSEN
jgi:uncharacterized protein (TIGR03435 family)